MSGYIHIIAYLILDPWHQQSSVPRFKARDQSIKFHRSAVVNSENIVYPRNKKSEKKRACL